MLDISSALKGDCVLSFALSCHDQEAEVLVLVHDHAGRQLSLPDTPIVVG